MTKMKTNKKKYFIFSGFIAVLISLLVCSELLISISSIDYEILHSSLYFFEDDYQYKNNVHIVRQSSDFQQMYELIPNSNASCLNCIHPLERKYKQHQIKISTNSSGFRNTLEIKKIKNPSMFRILIVGSSNTFGPTVNNDDTYPALLEKKLNEIVGKKKFEVINAGVCAYVPSQVVAYAERLIKEYQPDLVLIQEANRGRRAFALFDKKFAKLMEENQEILFENFPPFWDEDIKENNNCLPYAQVIMTKQCEEEKMRLSQRIHYFFVRHFRSYRLFLALHYKKEIHDIDKQDDQKIKRFQWQQIRFGAYADQVNYKVLKDFIVSSKHPPLVFFLPTWPSNPDCTKWDFWQKWYNQKYLFINPCHLPAGDEYRQIHPPSHVYQLYAEEIAQSLLRFLKSIER